MGLADPSGQALPQEGPPKLPPPGTPLLGPQGPPAVLRGLQGGERGGVSDTDCPGLGGGGLAKKPELI